MDTTDFKPITHFLGGVNVGASPQSSESVAESVLFRRLLAETPDLYFKQEYSDGEARPDFLLKSSEGGEVLHVEIKGGAGPSWLPWNKRTGAHPQGHLVFAASEVIKDPTAVVEQIRTALDLG